MTLLDRPFAVTNETHASRLTWYYAQIYQKLQAWEVNNTEPADYRPEMEIFMYYYAQYGAIQNLTQATESKHSPVTTRFIGGIIKLVMT